MLLIRKAFDGSDATYGHRRVWAQLARWGVRAGLELVRRLMRELGLVACQPRPWRPATTQQGAAGPGPGPGEPRLHRGGSGREDGR
jgi:putative transposase